MQLLWKLGGSKVTNFEKIKSMTEEEMAAFLDAASGEHHEFPCEYCSSYGYCEFGCSDAIATWLKVAPYAPWLDAKQ